MQKLDFSENTKALTDLLKSYEIIKFIDAQPTGAPINVNGLTPLIVESKSNYDKISVEDSKMIILQALEAPLIYSQENIGKLINSVVSITIQGNQKVHLFLQPTIMPFYNFHYALIKMSELCEKVLFHGDINELKDNDIIIFRILVDGDLEISRYAKILTLLDEIIDIIQKVSSEPVEEPKINLLDSGSDTNLGIKSTIEVSRSLFQIFKEVWDWILNRKFYKNKLRNSGLLENLNVMIAIKEAQEKGAIDEDTAKIYRETIIRRTEDLLELNVIPKDLIEAKDKIESQKLLNEFTEVKMLEAGNKQDESQ